MPDAGCKIIACVDVQPIDTASGKAVRSDVLWELAVRRMERVIRPNDWMCMLGANRFAVSFGNGVHRVPPSVLGSRLARALGDHLSVGADGLDVHVTVGISAGPSDASAEDLMAAALSSVLSARRRIESAPSESPRATVTVTHVPGGPAGHQDLPAGARGRTALPARKLTRRVMVPLAQPREHAEHSIRQSAGTVPRILIVGAETVRGDPPRLAVEAVAAMARRVGALATISPTSSPDRVLLDLYVTEPHVVVVVLESEAARREGTRPWERPARLVRALHDAGSHVVAVGIGASAAAVAACIEQGAIGLLDADDLPHELTALASAATAAGRSGSNGSNGNGPLDGYSRRFPATFGGLVGLTPSERKVLFHMMEGRSAAEIAEALVVSLPTVRSHIRSILRKLNVNSQLAAVAIANGALPDGVAGA